MVRDGAFTRRLRDLPSHDDGAPTPLSYTLALPRHPHPIPRCETARTHGTSATPLPTTTRVNPRRSHVRALHDAAASARVKPNTRVLNLDSQVVDIHMCTCYAIFDRPNRHHWLDPRSEFTAVVSCFRAGGDSFVVPRLFTQACKCSHICIGSATLLAPHAMLPHPCSFTSAFSRSIS
jgi:hypothetical protein